MRHDETPGLPLEPAASLAPEPPGMPGLSRGFAGEGAVADEPPDQLVGIAPPDHSWHGNALVWTLYAAGTVSMSAAVYLFATMTDVFRPGHLLGMAPLAFFPGAVMVWVARMIQTFKLAGWGVGMVCLLAWLVSSLLTLGGATDVTTIGISMLGAALSVLWMAYLWSRRDDFS